MATTTKHALPYPAGTDNAFPPEDIQALAEAVDTKMAVTAAGLLSARPAAGKLGAWYKATDGSGGLYFDDSAAWKGVLTASDAPALGLSSDGVVRRGKSIIATEESRTNTAYGTLTTPDQVEDVVLPADGLIVVLYQAAWKSSVADAARAAIFLNSNQLQFVEDSAPAGAPEVQEAGHPATANYGLLFTTGPGLAGISLPVSYAGGVATGQSLGVAAKTGTYLNPAPSSHHLAPGPCYIFAAAGTYDISVRFKATSGSVTAKERKLWVWTLGF